jgi:DNA-binding CsgD family transcriptional regulator
MVANIEDARKRLVSIWSEFQSQSLTKEELEAFLAQSRVLDQTERSNIRTVIFSYHDFSIHHINPGTARYFGSTPEEIIGEGAEYIMSCVHPLQVEAAIINTIPISTKLYNDKNRLWRNYHASYVNCSITCRQGNRHRSLFHAFPILFDEQDRPLLGMFLIYDLEPFIAGGVWWFRYKLGEQVFLFQHDSGKLEETDILSPRELEILQLISEGATSKEIAAQLFLSVNTVDNHRRNMLKRTGAVDTSALIHICKLCQIIE